MSQVPHEQRFGRAVHHLSEEDFTLSQAISPPARRPEQNLDLRSMRVDRLSDTVKAVLRRALRRDNISVYCEGCGNWYTLEAIPRMYNCRCGRSYRIEFVIFEEVEPE